MTTPNRTESTENFPVGSWLIPAALRPSVMVFYRVARAADDIADAPDLAPEVKTARLKAIDAVLIGGEASGGGAELEHARALRAHFAAKGLSVEHSRQLLQAFMADAINRPCRNWGDLLLYCRFSANPVGRFLLELHGEGRDAFAANDALCTSLQILNHLQDCKEDYAKLKRLYVPLDFLSAEGLTPEALLETRASAATRKVLDRVLDGVDQLNVKARALPGLIAHRGLRMEASAIVTVALWLARALRAKDPIAGRVELSKARKVGAMLIGAARGIRR